MHLFPITPPKDVRNKGLGFVDATGRMVIPQDYGPWPYSQFSPDGYCVVFSRRTYGAAYDIPAHMIIDQSNRVVLKIPQDHQIHNYQNPDSHGIFPVDHLLDNSRGSAWELEGREFYYRGRTRHYAMNLSGEIVFEAPIGTGRDGVYRLYESKDGLRSGLMGLIDRRGDVILRPQFSDMRWAATDPVIGVVRGGKFGVIDYNGDEVIPIVHPVGDSNQYGQIRDGAVTFYDAALESCVCMSLDGTRLARIPWTYWSPYSPRACPTISDGLMLIRELRGAKEVMYYLDTNGVCPMTDDQGGRREFSEVRVGYFSDGLATYQDASGMGYIDTTGQIAIAPTFASAGPFGQGLAQVFEGPEDRTAGRYAYIDTAGQVVVRNH